MIFFIFILNFNPTKLESKINFQIVSASPKGDLIFSRSLQDICFSPHLFLRSDSQLIVASSQQLGLGLLIFLGSTFNSRLATTSNRLPFSSNRLIKPNSQLVSFVFRFYPIFMLSLLCSFITKGSFSLLVPRLLQL